jgi:hypothetical protein
MFAKCVENLYIVTSAPWNSACLCTALEFRRELWNCREIILRFWWLSVNTTGRHLSVCSVTSKSWRETIDKFRVQCLYLIGWSFTTYFFSVLSALDAPPPNAVRSPGGAELAAFRRPLVGSRHVCGHLHLPGGRLQGADPLAGASCGVSLLQTSGTGRQLLVTLLSQLLLSVH